MKTQQNIPKQNRKDNTASQNLLLWGTQFYGISKNKTVKVNNILRATTEDIARYINHLINRKPDHISLHVDTNNLATYTP